MTSLAVSSCDDAILSAGRKIGENSNRKFRVVENENNIIIIVTLIKGMTRENFSDWKPFFFLYYCTCCPRQIRDKK